jgi:hypothetical protein
MVKNTPTRMIPLRVRRFDPSIQIKMQLTEGWNNQNRNTSDQPRGLQKRGQGPQASRLANCMKRARFMQKGRHQLMPAFFG